MQKLLYTLFALFLLAPITGELLHIQVGSLNLLPSDILILIIFPLWVLDKLKNDRQLRLGQITKTILFFTLVLVGTYFLNFLRFDFQEMKAGFSMLARFGMYISMAFVAFDLLDRDQTDKFRKIILVSMISSMTIVALFGFLQLKFFPSFFELGLYLYGWDPHIGRLLSTWFDPNFVAGFLAFMLCLTSSLFLYFYQQKNKKLALLLVAVSVMGVIALYMTFSRSGYLAMLLGLGVLALFKSRRLLIVMFLVCMLAFTFSSRVQERVVQGIDSAKGLFGLNEQQALDPTAELRVYSWKFASYMIHDYPLLGVGYGRYAYEINHRGHGFLADHHSGGSDSSLLTIWAQTGIFGLLAYMAIGFVTLVITVKRVWGRSDFESYMLLGLLCGFAGMMIHSIFVNSLLFALMMVYLWISLAVMDRKKLTKSE